MSSIQIYSYMPSCSFHYTMLLIHYQEIERRKDNIFAISHEGSVNILRVIYIEHH